MAFTPISNDFIQHSADASGNSAAGYFLKLYAASTTTPISAALDSAGSVLVAKVELDSEGFAKNASGGSTTIYIDQTYRLVLYINEADANNNTFANAVQDVDDIPQVFTRDAMFEALGEGFEAVKSFPTLAAAVADVSLADLDALNLAERTTGNGGGAMWDVVLSSTVTENTFNIVQCTGVATLSLVLRIETDTVWEAVGGRVGGVIDNLAVFNHLKTLKIKIVIPKGLWLFSTAISTSNAEADAITIQGDGMSRTVLMFRGTSGIELLGTSCAARYLTVVDGDSYATLPTTTNEAIDPAPVRGNITASTVGVLLDRSDQRCDSVFSRGFDSGFLHTNTKFYSVLYKCRATKNLNGHVSGSSSATDSPNFNFSNACRYSLNFEKNAWIRSGFHIYENCSFESCEDYHPNHINYPNGGVFVSPLGHAVLNQPYMELNNYYNCNPRSVIRSVQNIAPSNLFFSPVDMDRTQLGARSNNLLKAPFLYPWASTIAGSITLGNENTNLNADRRYSRVTCVGAGGVSKVLASEWNTLVRGIKPRVKGAEHRVKWGFWFRYVTDNFSTDKPEVNIRVRDVNGSDYQITDDARMNIYGDGSSGETLVNAIGGTGTVTTVVIDTVSNPFNTNVTDTSASFTGNVKPGMQLLNTTTGNRATIKSVISNTTINVDGDGFAVGNTYEIEAWQYIGGIHSVQVGLASGDPLESIRIQLTCEANATDCSSANRVLDIAEPELNLMYAASQGQEAYNQSLGNLSHGNVSNPPTDAELDTLFGTPRQAGSGFEIILDDNGDGANVYKVWSDGSNWWYDTLTKAT